MLKPVMVVMLAAVILVLPACGNDSAEADGKGNSLRVSIDGEDTAGGDATVDIAGDADSGKLELKLPGGLEIKTAMPKGVMHGSDFDIEGVGLYPGAKVASVNVNARAGKDNGNAVVKLGFSSPGDAAAVADWYEQQFAAKKVAVTRNGETFSGKTDDGDDFTLAMTPADGGTRGLLTIIDAG